MRRESVLAVALVLIAGGHAVAQTQVMPPLAEVARQAEAAKATARKAKKTYTNSDLSADPRHQPDPAPAPAAAPAAGFVSKTSGKTVPAEEMIAASEAKAEEATVAKESEETWRMRAASLRKQVDEMRARIEQLTAPDPLRDENPVLKRTNDVEIVNARAALEGLRKQWTRLEASARELKVPDAWLDPKPVVQ